MYRGLSRPPKLRVHTQVCAVAERSVSLRRVTARWPGGIGSANADMSNDKECERHSRRKSKGSCAMLISAGLAGS